MVGRPLEAREVQVLEVNAVARGVSIDQLMESAGHAVAEEAAAHLPPPPAALGVVCGLGNNGGDGLAAAAVLASQGYQPRIWLVGDPSGLRTSAARRRWDLVSGLRYVKVGPPTSSDLQGLPLVIDAMLGTGGHGPPREPYRTAVQQISTSGVPVLSVDLPTGHGSSAALRARWTVALETLKEGMEGPVCGEVAVRSIGMPAEAHLETGVGELALFPTPEASTRKSDSGRIAVIGGGPYAGAPFLAAMAALRAGADMVFVVVPGGIADLVQGYSPELIVRSVGEGRRFTEDDVPALAETVGAVRATSVLVGNGAGEAPETVAGLEKFLQWVLPGHPCVVDADGLRVLSHRAGRPFPGQSPSKLLLTPNLRELSHLVPGGTRKEDAIGQEEIRRAAARLRATLLVKGPVDTISDGEETKLNRTHHPAMVVGGAGDVLAGVCASLLARGLSAFQAGRLATYWTGRASLEAFERVSYGLLPSDLLGQLGPALRRGLEELRRLTDPGRRIPPSAAAPHE